MVINLKASSSSSNNDIIVKEQGLRKERDDGNAVPPLVTSSATLTTQNSSSSPPSPTSIATSNSVETFEVNYRTNVTSLFTTIENCDWEEAAKLSNDLSSHVRTWVVSTGTDDPSSWCVWRRLPIHEACRRQPPLSFILLLLNIFPESACEKTQFGELPIHLACGCGASEEVLNLLIVYYPLACMVRDNGGRTPCDILKTSGFYTPDISKRFVACEQTLQHQNKLFQEKIEKLSAKHRHQLQNQQLQADDLLQQKDTTNQNLQKKLQTYKRQISELVMTMKECEVKINEKNKAESRLMERIFQLENENAAMRKDNSNLKEELRASQNLVGEKEEKLQNLSKTLKNFWMEMTLAKEERNQMILMNKQWEKDMQNLLEKQVKLSQRKQQEEDSLSKLCERVAMNVDGILDSDLGKISFTQIKKKSLVREENNNSAVPILSEEDQVQLANAALAGVTNVEE